MHPVYSSVEWPQSQTWWRANILLDENGSAVGSDGTSRSLTSGRDRHLLRQIRAEAELVVTGGETVRKEGWHFPPHGELIVLSSSGLLPVESCPHLDRLTVVTDPDSLSQAISESVATRILCESGPRLLRDLLSHRRIDELFVSLLIPSDTANVDTIMSIVRSTLDVGTEDFELMGVVFDPEIAFARFQRRRVINGS